MASPCVAHRQPSFTAPVQVPDGDEQIGAGGQVVAGQGVGAERAADEDWRLRVEAHGLVDDARGQAQRTYLLHARLAVPHHCVNLPVPWYMTHRLESQGYIRND